MEMKGEIIPRLRELKEKDFLVTVQLFTGFIFKGKIVGVGDVFFQLKTEKGLVCNIKIKDISTVVAPGD